MDRESACEYVSPLVCAHIVSAKHSNASLPAGGHHTADSRRLTVFGAGWVGLVTGACFAEKGNSVVCVDVDAARIDNLRRGIVPMHGPGLPDLVANDLRSGRLAFTINAESAVRHGEIPVIAVGTPAQDNGNADTSQVLQVATAISRHMQATKLVMVKSTVLVGTADAMRQRIAAGLFARRASFPFDVVSNPEFLSQGAAIADFMKPDRIVIGSDSEARPGGPHISTRPSIRNGIG